MHHLAGPIQVHFLLFQRTRFQDDEGDVRGFLRVGILEYSHPSSNTKDSIVEPQMPVVRVHLKILSMKQSHVDPYNTTAA